MRKWGTPRLLSYFVARDATKDIDLILNHLDGKISPLWHHRIAVLPLWARLNKLTLSVLNHSARSKIRQQIQSLHRVEPSGLAWLATQDEEGPVATLTPHKARLVHIALADHRRQELIDLAVYCVYSVYLLNWELVAHHVALYSSILHTTWDYTIHEVIPMLCSVNFSDTAELRHTHWVEHVANVPAWLRSETINQDLVVLKNEDCFT